MSCPLVPEDPPETPPVLDYQARGRNSRTAWVLAAIWSALAALVITVNASLWIVAGLALFTLPAVWDLVADRPSGMRLDAQGLQWHSGRHMQQLPLARIKAVRLDRRLDLSLRVSLVLHDNRRIRLPQECLPRIDLLEDALGRAGLRVERHPFSLI
jgi:hypothetical protein